MPNDFFVPPRQSVLDLPISGSVGTFSIRSRENSIGSVKVQYIETHVGFAVTGDAEERLLQQLAPVREVFDVTELGFDELMQRDIDDSRVSTELIPYLLRDSGEALVKLFPPIIVVVLPSDTRGRPAALYPEVQDTLEVDQKRSDVKWRKLRSGAVGSEVFEFQQMVIGQQAPDPHNYAQLRLNTTGCKLAIVDGQHRAMALLALYRNWKQWPEKARQFQDYYKRWDSSIIREFDLSQVRLPVMVCTFPGLHEGNTGETLKVAEACRSVFLALNKNARPVTKARNYLLNDSDLVAHFLRTVLGQIKQHTHTSSTGLRLWNIELDGEGDKRALTSPMALSGVMHLYSLVEFLMLNSKWTGQLRLPRQNFWKKKDLTDCIRRLSAKSELGAERCDRANRWLIEKETAQILCDRFWRLHGRLITRILGEFRPNRIHNERALALEAKLRSEPNGATYHSILFGGQGIGKVFTDYVSRLREERDEIKDSLGSVPPALEASFKEFEIKSKSLESLVDEFYHDRTQKLLSPVPIKKIASVDTAAREIYRNTLTTEAFQVSLAMTFFSAMEACLDEAESRGEGFSQERVERVFEGYMDQINRFFDPDTPKEAWDIFRVFYGDVKHQDGSPTVIRSTTCLKKLLVPGELKPEEWPKFRYVLLELWSPTDDRFLNYVETQRDHLRLSALRSFQDRELDYEAKKLAVRVSDLSDRKVKAIMHAAKETFCKALKPLGVTISAADLLDDRIAEESSAEELPDDDSDEIEEV